MDNKTPLDNDKFPSKVVPRERKLNVIEILILIANAGIALIFLFELMSLGPSSEYSPVSSASEGFVMIIILLLICGVSLSFLSLWYELITAPEPIKLYGNIPVPIIVLNILQSCGFSLLSLITLFYAYFYLTADGLVTFSSVAFICFVMGPLQLYYTISAYNQYRQLHLETLREKKISK